MKRTRICLSVISVNEGIVLHREKIEKSIANKPIAEYNKRHNEFIAKEFTNQSGNRIVINYDLFEFDNSIINAIKEFKKLKRA